MDDHELIMALEDEHGGLLFCGGDEFADLDMALAFVRFVHALPPTRIHPDDVVENSTADFATTPRWSAHALECVFSDKSPEEHAQLVVEFMATLTAAQRARVWSSVRAQIDRSGISDDEQEKTVLDALADRIEP